MANINQVSPDGGTTIYDLEDTTARNGIDAIKDGQSIESFSDVEAALETKADTSSLGTAATKNSTTTITSDSTDLVESGAVYEALRDANFINGKNLLPVTLDRMTALNINGTWNNNVYTPTANPSLTFTLNSDGSVTVNGTAIDQTIFIVGNVQFSENKSIIYNGITGGSSSTYSINIRYKNNYKDDVYNGDSSIYSIDANEEVRYVIVARNGLTANNVKIYPMIRESTETDPTYEPYYIPLKDVVPNKCDNSVIGTVEGANASKAWSAGEHFIKDGQFKEVTQPIASGGAINDSNTVDRQIADCLVKRATFSSTTGNTGIITLSIPDGAHILAVEIENVIGIIYRRLSQPYLGIKCLNPADMAVLTETAVSGTYYYID